MRKILVAATALCLILSGCSIADTYDDTYDYSSASSSETYSGNISEDTHNVYFKSDLNSGVTVPFDSVNNKNRLHYISTACYVEQTDTLFYSDGDKLYQKNGSTTNALIDINAASISLIDGWLYFVSCDEKSESGNTGDAYKYCPETGELKRIFSGNANHISHDGEKLIITTASSKTTEHEKFGTVTAWSKNFFECDTDGENLHKISGRTIEAVDGNRTVCSEVENNQQVYYLLSGGEKIKLAESGENGAVISLVSICDNRVYWFSENFSNAGGRYFLMCYDIDKKQVMELKLSEYIFDYTVMDGMLYIYTGSLLVADSDLKIVDTRYCDGSTVYDSISGCGDKLLAMKGKNLFMLESQSIEGFGNLLKGVKLE